MTDVHIFAPRPWTVQMVRADCPTCNRSRPAESTYPTHGGIMVRTRTYALHECIGWAVCLAVLAKHGIQWPTAGSAPGASATPP